MTVDDESTRVESNGTTTVAKQEQNINELSLFQKFCCCCSTSTKEPPVQLIRSGSLTYTQGQNGVSEPVISAAKTSVDDEDINLELRTENKNTNGGNKNKNTLNILKKDDDDISMNMNDFLMSDVLKRSHTEEDRTEAVEEEATSISTDVVQEIDEHELRNALKQTKTNDEVPKLKGRAGISKRLDSVSIHSEQIEGDDRKMSVIEFIQSEAENEKLPAIIHKTPAEQDKYSEATHSEITDSDDELSEVVKKTSVQNGVSSNTTARLDRNSVEPRAVEFKELSSSEEELESEDEIMIIEKEKEVEDEEEDNVVPPPLPSISPPRLSTTSNEIISNNSPISPIPPPRSPRPSKMYENADSSGSESDDESTEAKPVSTSGLSKMQPVVFAPSPNAVRDEDASSIDSDLSSDDVVIKSASSSSTASSLPSEGSNSEKENNNAVTRISVKSDGRAEIHSPRSPVRVTLEVDRQDLTDDEFSEKLI